MWYEPAAVDSSPRMKVEDPAPRRTESGLVHGSADEELRRREAQLAEAQQIAHIGSWEWDIAADRLTWSDELYRIFGVPPGEFAATFEAFLGRVHPDDRHVVEARVMDALALGTGFSFDHRIVRPDGSVRVLHADGRVVMEASGRPVRMAGTGHDITDRKAVEDALRESEHRHRRMFEDSPQPMWVYDAETFRFLAVNEAAVRRYGYSREEFLSMTIEDIRPPEEVPALMAHLGRRTGTVDASGPWRHRARDGSLSEVEISSHAMEFAGRPAWLVLVRDVTEQRRMDAALRRRNEELEALSETTVGLISGLDVEGLLRTVVRRAAGLMSTEHAWLSVFDPLGGHLAVRVGEGLFAGWVGFRQSPEVGLDGAVWSRGRPVTVERYGTWPHRVRAFDEAAVGPAVAIPLRAGTEMMGVIGVARTDEEPGFTFAEMELLERFAYMASLALQNARLFAQAQDELAERRRVEETLRRRKEELEALHRTALGLIERLDPTELLKDIVRRAAALVGSEHGYLYTLEPSGEEMAARVGTGFMGGRWVGTRVTRGAGVAGRVWDRGATITVDDYHSWPGRVRAFDELPLRAVVGVPLRSRDRVVGVIGVARFEEGRSFAAEEISLLERFGELASLALHNARLYEAEREATARLRRLDEMKNGFLDAVSHELRTPLTSVLGYALTLARPDLSASPRERGEMLDILIANARKLDRLLCDLLDLDRLVRGALDPRRRPTDLRALVDRVLVETDVRDRSVGVDVAASGISVDPAKVERIVENLVVNAVRHTPAGTPLWVRSWDHDGGVVVAVEDAGPGVSPEERQEIFKPFRHGSRVASHAPSTGIGLSVVARFAELHGGRAWVEDRSGGGASFRVFLPHADEARSTPSRA